VTFRSGRYDGGGMRYLRFQHWLEQLADDSGGLTAIHFEEVRRHIGTDAAASGSASSPPLRCRPNCRTS